MSKITEYWYRPAFLMLCLFTIAGIVAACASAVTPETARERHYAVESQYIATLETAIELRDQGVISEGTEQKLSRLFESANLLLRLSHNFLVEEGNEDQAIAQLEQVNSLLIEIRDILWEESEDG